ncbi:MAG: hypothetical protein AAF787_11830 [Chloroflexota bacterium]
MAQNKLEAFKEEVQTKINRILEEFAEGKLNRDQFHAIYERYNSQMELAEKATTTDVPVQEDGGTMVLREKYMGKAQGLIIFDNRSGNVIETLGGFGVGMAEVQPILQDFTAELKAGRIVDRAVRPASDNRWLLFVAGKFTTVVTLFQNEPSGYQTTVIQRMHGEFENANHGAFENDKIDAEQLVFPFYAFVKRNLAG